ncbi:MAG: hypothetical protein C4527_26715 [Candidatus Omnitrophota bacterium]|jgi:outer membrane protein assembly factor BamB|nr:MAG: hypothetical protein C4527_26715 [Candidatus Omnitrophota bacterium]
MKYISLMFIKVTIVVTIFNPIRLDAEDWPTYQHDYYRSGVTAESIDVNTLRQTWMYESTAPPQTAWSGPAKWDAYANIIGLKSMRNYDPVFYTIVVGESLFFSSSADDSVYCLNALDGTEQWSYCTDGPVRIAPTFASGKLYFGSDDGYVYCLDAVNGELLWKYTPETNKQLIPSNGKLIPLWPCRSGVLVADGIAYFTAALLPWKESYLCAVDAETGKTVGDGMFQVTQENVTMEGALLASSTRLYVPQGRRAPMIFNRLNGSLEGVLSGGGGVFAFLTPDSHFFHGPGNKTGWITDSNAETRDSFAKFDNANCMVVSGDMAYVLQDDILFALDRKKREIRWKVKTKHPFSIILADDMLFAGGDENVGAYSSKNGELLWNSSVQGQVYDLAVANHGLFVSTTSGHIYAFHECSE